MPKKKPVVPEVIIAARNRTTTMTVSDARFLAGMASFFGSSKFPSE